MPKRSICDYHHLWKAKRKRIIQYFLQGLVSVSQPVSRPCLMGKKIKAIKIRQLRSRWDNLALCDALIITLQINTYSVKCIPVDTGSSVDIIFEEAFSHIRISRDRVKPISLPIYEFTGASALVEGIILLTIIVDTVSFQAAQTIDFLIVKRDEQSMKHAEPVKKLISIPLKAGYEERHLRIDSTLELILRKRCLPFFKALKKIKNFAWMTVCQAFFEALQTYLSSPPLLTKPIVGDELFLYLTVTESTVSAVLSCEQDDKQLPIHYISKVLQGAELYYPNAEKLAFVLLIASHKL
ncbi:hypothetical protein RJ639_019343 [Escallonia herrerae]|uniref:Reverse transcriptase/retrotransposon-derived protein RNase H-like domain-containing protein n=1 Tax=Escallonia herrerae TaxID=1293975 RepID=A0AA88VA02_9ASTE|nr:hypothetical protein RJ639_019343 [Escallonia herrerae]